MELHLTAAVRDNSITFSVVRRMWTHPALTPVRQAGTRFDLPTPHWPTGMESWVDLLNRTSSFSPNADLIPSKVNVSHKPNLVQVCMVLVENCARSDEHTSSTEQIITVISELQRTRRRAVARIGLYYCSCCSWWGWILNSMVVVVVTTMAMLLCRVYLWHDCVSHLQLDARGLDFSSGYVVAHTWNAIQVRIKYPTFDKQVAQLLLSNSRSYL